MRRLLFLLFCSSCFAFTTVPQANIVFDSNYQIIVPENTTVNSKPQVVFNVMNNGTRNAYIVNSSLKTSHGYVVLSAPSSIKPGYTSSFIYEFTNFLCEMGAADFTFEIWYEYVNDEYRNLTSESYEFGVEGFLKLLNVQPEKEEMYIDIEKGDSISFIVKNDANQPVNYAFSVEYPETFFPIFQTSNLEFEKYDFEDWDFFLGPKSSQLFTIEIFPVSPVKDSYLRLKVYNKDCPSVYQTFEKIINVVWVKEGLFVRNIVPDLSFPSLIILFFAACLLFSKIYY